MAPSFLSCPLEIQCQILSYVLIVPTAPLGELQGLVILDGARKTRVSRLLLVSRAIGQLATEIELELNRVTLAGPPWQSTFWLEVQPAHLLRKIRHLDLSLEPAQLTEQGCRQATTHEGWPQLVETIGQKLTLEKLHLTIDGSLDFWSFIRGKTRPELDFSWIKPVYDQYMAPFGKEFAACKDFWVFWPFFEPCEKAAEKGVKGADYDSAARGKIAYKQRDPRIPHGSVPDMFDASGILLPQFRSYKYFVMVDDVDGIDKMLNRWGIDIHECNLHYSSDDDL